MNSRHWAVLSAMLTALVLPRMAAAQAADTAEPTEITLGHMTMGYNYFNRPGADLKAHDADVVACAAEAARTISFDEQLRTGAGQGVLGAIIGSYIESAAHRGAVASGLENCMVVRGWRVVKLPDAEGEALAKLPPADLAARLAPWVGAAQPHGEVVRVWANDAANGATRRYSLRPDHTNDGQLSLTEATTGDLHQFAMAEQPIDSARGALDAKWPKKPLTVSQLGSAPDGAAIFMVQIKGLSLHNGVGILFNRIGTPKDIYPSRTDHGPDLLLASKGTLFAHKDGDMFVFAVPPGRWRVYGMGIGPTLNFCLGSPSFEIAAGEVVYAGSFDFGATDMGPNLDLGPAKAWLGAQPQAQTLRPAAYVNGSKGLCGANHIYALEVKGAPFEPGYAWGSAAPATAAAGVAAAASSPTNSVAAPAATPATVAATH
jgi:hypothetical protein